jgi:hypothetical protein
MVLYATTHRPAETDAEPLTCRAGSTRQQAHAQSGMRRMPAVTAFGRQKGQRRQSRVGINRIAHDGLMRPGCFVALFSLTGGVSYAGAGDEPALYGGHMLRPGSWSRPAGGSPVRVDTGVPGSRPRFVVERRRAERGVESLFGGSKHAGRSVKRTLQPRQSYNGGAEPLMSRRRPRRSGLVPVMTWRVLPGYGGRHACMVWAGTGETRLPGLRRAKTGRISRW